MRHRFYKCKLLRINIKLAHSSSLPDGLMERSENQVENRAVLKNRMEFDMSDLIRRIEYNKLFTSLREKHYGMNITKIVCDQSGSGNEKSDGI